MKLMEFVVSKMIVRIVLETVCMSHSMGDLDVQRLQSDDLRVRYQYALEIAQGGNSGGLETLCEAIQSLAWNYVNLYKVIDTLGELGDERAAETLIDFLSKWMGHARGNALAALLKIGTENAVAAVFEELRTPSPWFGWGTGGLIAAYGERYVPRLVIASTDPDRLMRARSVYTLGLIATTVNDRSILETLVSALKDEDATVRDRAAWGLARTYPDQAESVLLSALDDDNVEVSQWAAEGLYNLESHRGTALNVLLASLGHEDWLIRRNAVWALKRIADKQAVPALIDTLQNDNNRGIRSYAAEALGLLDDQRAVQPLITSLSDTDELVRAETIKALVLLLGSDVLPLFIDLLFDTESVVQGTVIEVWEKHNYHPHLHSD